MNGAFDLAHPYARYGLAVALLQERILPTDMTEQNVREILVRALEIGLDRFRLETLDDPLTTNVLRFNYIPNQRLEENRSLVYSKGLGDRGLYLAPTIITNEMDKQQGTIIQGTYDGAVNFIAKLRGETPLWTQKIALTRSFAPTTSKINNGGSQSPPEGNLFEAACSTITTITPLKSAAKVGKSNTAIIPDLPITELREFVEVFRDMTIYGLSGSLLTAKLPPRAKVEQAQATKRRSKKVNSDEADKTKKSEYRRPPLFDGNYPFAPRSFAFGVVGLLAAIGTWGIEANERGRALHVLESIAGTAEKLGRPLYIVSYEGTQQVNFAHHIVALASAGQLFEIINGLIHDTRIYDDLHSRFPSVRSKSFENTYKLFHLLASRFLQLWTTPAFADFFATQVEYSPKIQPLFEVYFMNAKQISKEIVQSARAYGQWLNRAAYFVAESEIEKGIAPDKRYEKVMKEKAKILVELESAARSAKSSLDMLDRVQTRAHRLLLQDAPVGATTFFDATASGELDPQDALHLLATYMRLRSAKTDEPEASAMNYAAT